MDGKMDRVTDFLEIYEVNFWIKIALLEVGSDVIIIVSVELSTQIFNFLLI